MILASPSKRQPGRSPHQTAIPNAHPINQQSYSSLIGRGEKNRCWYASDVRDLLEPFWDAYITGRQSAASTQ